MTPIAGFVDDMVAKADCAKHQYCRGFTGFNDIDDMTDGMKKYGLILLAARPGAGKFMFALNMAGNAAIDYHRRVAFFCMEMDGELFAQSLVRSRARIRHSAIRNHRMTFAEKDRFAATAQIVKEAPLFVDERRDWDVAELTRTVREMNSEQKLDLVVIDYLQLVTSDKGDTREEKLENVVRELKALSYELRIPIIVTALLSRHNERDAGRPKLKDLRELGTTVQLMDSIWILDRRYIRKHWNEDEHLAELYVEKDYGYVPQDGKPRVIFLKCFAEYSLYSDIDEDESKGVYWDFAMTPEEDSDR